MFLTVSLTILEIISCLMKKQIQDESVHCIIQFHQFLKDFSTGYLFLTFGCKVLANLEFRRMNKEKNEARLFPYHPSLFQKDGKQIQVQLPAFFS